MELILKIKIIINQLVVLEFPKKQSLRIDYLRHLYIKTNI